MIALFLRAELEGHLGLDANHSRPKRSPVGSWTGSPTRLRPGRAPSRSGRGHRADRRRYDAGLLVASEPDRT